MKFILTYPAWYILLCILFSGIATFILYHKNKRLSSLNKKTIYLLSGLRFTALFILCFLLLEPLIKLEKNTIEKPIIIFAHDNSSSLLLSKDSSYYKGEYLSKIELLQKKLQQNFDVKSYTYGNQVKEGLQIDFNDKYTDISELFDEIQTRYMNRNIGSIILAGDGIYNRGTSPVYAAKKIKHCPVYTIALGDTNVRKDLIIADVMYNKLAYLDNDFPVNVMVNANHCNNNNTTIKILQNGNIIAAKNLSINRDYFTETFSFSINAKKTGVQKFTILIEEVNNELTYENNRKDIFIEILESKQKVLLLANAPHPDINAIKLSLEANKNYELTAIIAPEFDGNTDKYNLVILYQIPSLSNRNDNVLSKIKAKKIPVWFVLGTQTNIEAFNAFNSGLQITNYRNNINSVTPLFNKDFLLFNLSENTQRIINKFTPLQIPFGDYKTTPAVISLFKQKIGSIETNFPLFFFNKENENKLAVTCGEGIWRWRMNEYAINENTDASNEIIQKTVQYLSNRENKNPFKVYCNHLFMENEKVVFTAELHNENYEQINNPEVKLVITDSAKKEFLFTFSKSGKGYRLDAGMLPVGEYTYKASTAFNGKNYSATGAFTISPVTIENINAQANHALLYNISVESGGKMFYPNEIDKIENELSKNEEIKPVLFTEQKLDDVINKKWIFFFVLFLLGIEWFIRKIQGAY